MRIKRVIAKGFRNIGNKVDISFPKEGIIGILGKNERGKSTILEAIEFAFYGLKQGSPGSEWYPREDIITWGKSKADVTVYFEHGGIDYRVHRVLKENSHDLVLYDLTSEKEVCNGVTTVEDRIEEMLGMDRKGLNSMIFIKQDALDRLEELGKQDREEMVNRLIGIEVFDEVRDKAHEKKKEIKKKIERKKTRKQELEKSKERYEKKKKKKENLEEGIPKIEEEKEKVKEKLKELKQKREKLEWVNKYRNNKNLLGENKKKLGNLKKLKEEKKNKKDDLEIYKEFEDEYKEEYEELNTDLEKFEGLEEDKKDAKEELGSWDEKVEKLSERIGLEPEEVEGAKLRSKEDKAMNRTIIFGVLSVAIVIGGLVVLPIASLISILTGFLAYRSWSKRNEYRNKDKKSEELRRAISNKEEIVDELEGIKERVKKLREKTGYEGSWGIEDEMNNILEKLKNKTGEESFEGLASIKKKLKKDVEGLKKDIKDRETVEELKSKIKGFEEKIEELKGKKPAGADKINYSEEKHEEVKKKCGGFQEKLSGISDGLEGKKGELKTIEGDLEDLEEDLEDLKGLKEELKQLKKEKRAHQILKETYRKVAGNLRDKVIPAAQFKISQILPTLTNERYSKLEISDDMEIKAHSVDAGGIKEKDIFSGGTQDQFLIAMRLAFTEAVLSSKTGEERFPMLMDECISSSDETRTDKIFEVLERKSEVFGQIFIVSHEDVKNKVDDYIEVEWDEDEYTRVKNRSW